MSGMDIEDKEIETIFLEANEKLLASKAYILFTVDDRGNDFYFDLSKLNSLEATGLLKIASDRLMMVDMDINNDMDDE